VLWIEGCTGFVVGSRWFYIPIALVWTIPVFVQMIVALDDLVMQDSSIGVGLQKKVKIIIFLILMLHYTIWIYAFNPCISSPDSEYLFYQAHVMGKVGMTNWQPPFYAIVLSMLLKICDSATFLIYVQCTAYAILLVQIIDYLKQRSISKYYLVFVYLVGGFAFNNVIQMVTLWKDIPYMISILWLTFLLVQLVIDDNCINIIFCLKLALALVCTALFRQNGILPAGVTVVLLIVYAIKRKRKKLLAPVVAFAVAFFLITGPIYDYYQVVDCPGLKYFALANDIVGTYYITAESSDEVIDLVNEITSNNPDEYTYNAYYTSYNSSALGDYSVGEFIKLYMKTFIEHPMELTLEFLRRNSVLWSIVRPNPEYAGCVNYLSEYHSDSILEYTYDERIPNPLTNLLTLYSVFLTRIQSLYLFAWRTGIYILMLLTLVVLLLCKKKIVYLIPFVPVFANILALYVSCGWTDYRYFWPTAILTLLLFPFGSMTLGNKGNEVTQ
jgi:hypothetical protein